MKTPSPIPPADRRGSDVARLSPPTAAGTAIDRFVGCRLRKRRTEVGIAIDALAQALSMPPKLIEAYECGAVRIAPEHLLEFSYLLDVDLSFFYKGFA